MLVRARQRDGDRHYALQSDGDDRHLRLRADLRHDSKEHTVGGHRVVNARSGEHALTQKAERRHRDARCDEPRSALAENCAHDGGGRSCRCREARCAEHANADDVHEKINGDHASDAEEKSDGEIALRTLHLAGHKTCRLPAAIRKHHRGHRCAETKKNIAIGKDSGGRLSSPENEAGDN